MSAKQKKEYPNFLILAITILMSKTLVEEIQ